MNNIPFRTNEVIALIGMIIILVYGLFFTENRNEIITLIGLFAAASYRLMPSLNRIVNSLNFINVNQVSIDNLNRYIEYFHLANSQKLKRLPVTFERSIEFRNITFSFPDAAKPVLENISLEVKKGEKVGFIGKSGSGKTTLMNILLRFYVPQSGKILVDGTEITDENIGSWRSKIGYVKQDIFLMDASIRDNITFGDEHPDEQRLQAAIQQASLSEWINSLPDGVNTMTGEDGSRLSGGQKQRIGIARALYRNAEVLIFDEATSALDITTEQEVTFAIDRLSNTNKTIFIIAHRITTLKNCDRIYELSNGSVLGTFTYKELADKVF
jgi:ABC-type multidrug transport system fused ATPase/permease subunit